MRWVNAFDSYQYKLYHNSFNATKDNDEAAYNSARTEIELFAPPAVRDLVEKTHQRLDSGHLRNSQWDNELAELRKQCVAVFKKSL